MFALMTGCGSARIEGRAHRLAYAALGPDGAQPNMSDSIQREPETTWTSCNRPRPSEPTVDVSDAPAGFSGLTINSVVIKNVAVTDEPGVYISDTSLAVTDGGGLAATQAPQTYMVVLTRAPIRRCDGRQSPVTNTDVSASTLSAFTTANWLR